jgi:hypothetical protein
MSLQDFKVYTKTYDYMNWLFPITMKFPKSQRFVLAQRIENIMLIMLENIIEGNSSPHKLPCIQQALIKLEVLQVLVRFARDQHFLSLQKYEYSSQQMAEIGRLLGGWLRKVKREETTYQGKETDP